MTVDPLQSFHFPPNIPTSQLSCVVEELDALETLAEKIQDKEKKKLISVFLLYNSLAARILSKCIFSIFPSEWIEKPSNEWPKNFPHQLKTELKDKLLNDSIIKTYFSQLNFSSLLDDKILHFLFCIGYHRLKEALQGCSQETLFYLANKQAPDVNELIRKNLTLRPDLSVEDFTIKLKPILELQDVSIEGSQLKNQLHFVQFLIHKPSQSLPFKVSAADELYVFLYTYLQGMQTEDFKEELVKIINECNETSSLFLLARNLKNVREGELPCEDRALPHLSKALFYLNQVAAPLQLNSVGARPDQQNDALFGALYQRIDNFHATRTFLNRNIWEGCQEMIFGFNFVLMDKPIYQNCKVRLNQLYNENPLISFSQLKKIVSQEFFQEGDERSSSALGNILIKTWWFGKHLDGCPSSFSERLFSYHVRHLLIDDENWGLSCSAVIAILKTEFLKTYPFLPFNSCYVETLYHSLHTKRQSHRMPV